MNRKLWPLTALAIVALIGVGCGGNDSSGGSTTAATQEKAVKFAQCMRENGISQFPDPDASGHLTIDGVLNGSSIDSNSPTWTAAVAACKDLQPPNAFARTALRTFRIPPLVSPSSTRIESHPPTRQVG
jgi:hypothetical protein